MLYLLAEALVRIRRVNIQHEYQISHFKVLLVVLALFSSIFVQVVVVPILIYNANFYNDLAFSVTNAVA